MQSLRLGNLSEAMSATKMVSEFLCSSIRDCERSLLKVGKWQREMDGENQNEDTCNGFTFFRWMLKRRH